MVMVKNAHARVGLIVRCHGCGGVIYSGSVDDFARRSFYESVDVCPLCGRKLSTKPIDVKVTANTS